MRSGPLVGLRVLEFAGIGPGPFCGMLLADMGADVVRIERPRSGPVPDPRFDVSARGRRTITLDLKLKADVTRALDLADRAEVLIEGFRPGVMERLGLGPERTRERNPGLVYGRMTGWGQHGPQAHAAGHDANYIALTGALGAIGPSERPVLPLNLLGDYGGGGVFLAVGVLAALSHARSTGQGQVVDCAISDCTAVLMAPIYGMLAAGQWRDGRSENRLDGAAPFYNVYQCADGLWVTVCSLEPQFYALLLQQLELPATEYPYPLDRTKWTELGAKISEIMATRTRSEWCRIMEGTDVCFAPVLSMAEAPEHPHNRARQTFVQIAGVTQPAPAPRFSATPAAISSPPPTETAEAEIFADWTARQGGA